MFALKAETSAKYEPQIDTLSWRSLPGFNLLLFIPPNEKQRQ